MSGMECPGPGGLEDQDEGLMNEIDQGLSLDVEDEMMAALEALENEPELEDSVHEVPGKYALTPLDEVTP